jgi:hypothetical protein
MSELIPHHRWKPFFGAQEDFSVAGKYRGSKSLVRGWKGFIYITNVDPRTEPGVSESTANYITGNSHIITLDRPLFDI